VLTIEESAKNYDKDIFIFEELREIEFSSDDRIMTDKELYPLVNKMFINPDYSIPGGESSNIGKNRAIGVLNKLIEDNQGKKIVIGTHGMIMTLVMSYFDSKYDFNFLLRTSKPDIYRMEFDEENLIEIKRIWN
jgi:2,3-bisphosphoglycerate-dependent phosphoglycerate mutase